MKNRFVLPQECRVTEVDPCIRAKITQLRNAVDHAAFAGTMRAEDADAAEQSVFDCWYDLERTIATVFEKRARWIRQQSAGNTLTEIKKLGGRK